jgi:HEAT repeat protein
MPLIKRDSPEQTAAPALEPLDRLAAGLRDPDPERRWSAARRMGGRPGAADHLAAALEAESEPRVVEAIFTSLARTGGEEAVRVLLPWLRSEDAARRGGAIEALQMMPDAIDAHMSALLQDPDCDVRILACELTRKMPRERATALLCALLDRDDHPNACASAVDVLAEVGTRDAVPCLERCGERFSRDPFLPFAIAAAVESIRKHAG